MLNLGDVYRIVIDKDEFNVKVSVMTRCGCLQIGWAVDNNVSGYDNY